MPQYIEDSHLEGWDVIGSGGFGLIYKARHRRLACNVAVKLLHYDDGSNEFMLREINMMRQGSSPHVVYVHGVFRGRPPRSGSQSTQLGVVMELMDRGSLFSLQETLGGPPPWPLVFRLAHQVALGLNFLHSLQRPVLHLDLKPHNVLLDNGLNAKLTDFGLSRISHSVSLMSRRGAEPEWGTTTYMPPEAFNLTYEPRRASDIYSYGILLWSLVTGKQPYPNANRCIVELRIPLGQRPPLKDIEAQAAGVEGLTGLKELMVRCWDNKREQRPSALECTVEAETLFALHAPAVLHAVYQVLKELHQTAAEGASGASVESWDRVHGPVTVPSEAMDECDDLSTAAQEMASGRTAKPRVKERVEDPPSSPPASVRGADSAGASLTSPSTGRSRRDGTGKDSQQAITPNPSSQNQTETAAAPKEVLLETLEALTPTDFKKFKWYLQQQGVLRQFPAIPKRHLEDADRMDTVDRMFETYVQSTITVTRIVLLRMRRNSLLDTLSKNIPGAAVKELQQSGASAGPDPSRGVRAAEPGLKPADLRRYSCELTVDSNTVNRKLKLSDNNRKVTHVREKQPYPDHPERFDPWAQLLCGGALAGRCYWEVEWTGWVEVGVSYWRISRKGDGLDRLFGRNPQSWSLKISGGRFSVCHNCRETSIPSSSSSSSSSSSYSSSSSSSSSVRVPHRAAVYVDCAAGTLSFYRVSSDSLIHLHTFSTTFTEPLYPGFKFWSYGSSVSL